jgi:hypothetical protein
MAIVNLSELKEGMVVARPVMVQGKVLLDQGKTLSAKILHILKAWGITEVEIKGDVGTTDSGFPADLPDPDVVLVRKLVEERLRGIDIDNNEIMTEVKRVMIKREVDRVSLSRKEPETSAGG